VIVLNPLTIGVGRDVEGGDVAQAEQMHAQVRTAAAVAGRESARAEQVETESQRLALALKRSRRSTMGVLSELRAMNEHLSQLRIDSATAPAVATTQLDAARAESLNLREQLHQVDAEARGSDGTRPGGGSQARSHRSATPGPMIYRST
jgi:hypothetical protein